MKELNKNYVYSLEDLTSEEKNQLLEKLIALDSAWNGEASRLQLFSSKYLYFSNTYKPNGEWLVTREMYYTNKEIVNAKELFYTLENVQVDCRELTEEQIDKLVNVYESNNIPKTKSSYDREYVKGIRNFIMRNYNGCHWFSDKEIKFNTITYEKFMELFSEPQYEVKYIAEQPNDFKQITDSIASLLQYKNEKYGNSALEPLNVFQGKCKVGQRLDDKLARVKNNNTLQKNDVADLIGYLFLVCKENNWTNFDEFKD